MMTVQPARASALSLLLVAALAGSMAACGGGADPGDDEAEDVAGASLVVYSGRNESLIGPLLANFEEATDVAVEVRYGSTTEMAATLLEEGERSPADVFLSQDAAALGAIAQRGLFVTLPDELLAKVEARFRSPAGDWVGLSGRARSIVYNTERISPEELPASLPEITDERFRGRFGVAPTNGSFQAHMAVYSAVHGAAALDELLAGMVANEPRRYPKNSAIVEAVIAGEVDLGLVNHYYLWRALVEQPEAPARNYFPAEGKASGFINIAGAGLLSDGAAARELLAYLLGAEAQRYFARETFELPLAAGVEPEVELPPLAELTTPELDFGAISAVLEDTLERITASGLVE